MMPSTSSLAVGFALSLGAALGATWVVGLPAWPAALLLAAHAALSWPGRTDSSASGAPPGAGARLGLANGITLGRGALLALLAAWAVALPPWPSLILAAVIAFAFGLDGLDGLVARRTGTATPFGARLDMELDGLAVYVFAALAWRTGVCGPWILLAGAWRTLFIAAGAPFPWMRAPLDDFPPRRFACGLTLGGLSLAVALPQPGAWLVAAASFAVLTASFSRDVVYLWRHR